jgi:nucleoside-diphosphate-sugar epimerase
MQAVANLTAELLGASVNSAAAVDYADNENKVQALNCDATRRTLGWSPQVSFAEGIAKLAEWFDARGDTSALARLAETDAELIVKSAISKAS